MNLPHNFPRIKVVLHGWQKAAKKAEGIRKTDSLKNITRFPEGSNICPSDNEPPVRSG
jgi:hypothetical protein